MEGEGEGEEWEREGESEGESGRGEEKVRVKSGRGKEKVRVRVGDGRRRRKKHQNGVRYMSYQYINSPCFHLHLPQHSNRH